MEMGSVHNMHITIECSFSLIVFQSAGVVYPSLLDNQPNSHKWKLRWMKPLVDWSIYKLIQTTITFYFNSRCNTHRLCDVSAYSPLYWYRRGWPLRVTDNDLSLTEIGPRLYEVTATPPYVRMEIVELWINIMLFRFECCLTQNSPYPSTLWFHGIARR